ncbi:MAG: hypothetical protein LE180_01705 [Endomicrobium sp.]|uniref:hypothetical protein n=1 Tax=Candidatus Endomicrobiellum pyrsonymphae TaxID=1408203 RepID=UPI003572E6F6|nr:hypothetical protein [Endomicrobium sp.]
MGRKNMFEILADNYNAGTALKRIAILFHSKLFIGSYDCYVNATIEEIVDKYNTFGNWKSRNTYLDCRDMRNTLGLAECPPEEADALLILKYLEYYINICALAKRANCNSEYQRSEKFGMLMVDIRKLIDYLNYEERRIESKDKILVIPKNPAGTAVAEISSPQTGVAILKYHHHLLKGDVIEKRKLLQTIAIEYEQVLKSKSCEPKAIFVNTNALLNNLSIRHGNKDNQKNIAQFRDGELETWYDELYQMLLLCVLLNDNSARMKKIDDLLKSIKK